MSQQNCNAELATTLEEPGRDIEAGHVHPLPIGLDGFMMKVLENSDRIDTNEIAIIKMRGVSLILSGDCREKESRKTMRMGKKSGNSVGVDCADRHSDTGQKPA